MYFNVNVKEKFDLREILNLNVQTGFESNLFRNTDPSPHPLLGSKPDPKPWLGPRPDPDTGAMLACVSQETGK